jgi:hypothetical protein
MKAAAVDRFGPPSVLRVIGRIVLEVRRHR